MERPIGKFAGLVDDADKQRRNRVQQRQGGRFYDETLRSERKNGTGEGRPYVLKLQKQTAIVLRVGGYLEQGAIDTFTSRWRVTGGGKKGTEGGGE